MNIYHKLTRCKLPAILKTHEGTVSRVGEIKT